MKSKRLPKMTESPFDLGGANPLITLAEGGGSVTRGIDLVELPSLRVFLSSHPSWGLRVEGSGQSTDPALLSRALTGWEAERIEMPSLKVRGTLHPQTVQIGGNFTGRTSRFKFEGQLREVEAGGARKLRRVLFHVPNFPDFHGSAIAHGRGFRTGRLDLTFEDWQIILDARPELSDLLKGLRAQGGFAITHVGLLSRADTPFTRGEASEVLNGLHWFLSFVRGAWTSPVLWRAYAARRSSTWTHCSEGRIDRWGGSHRWCDWTNWKTAKQAYDGYMGLWRQPVWQQSLKLAIGQYLTANKPNPVEAAIVAAQSGLELLSWLRFVEFGSANESDWRNQKKYPADKKIRQLLSLASVDLAIPSQLASLINLDHNWPDGPAVVAGVRNRLVHPQRAKGAVGWPDDVLVDTWLLMSRYLELALLHAMGVRSPIRDRLGASQWVGSTVNPPWVP